MSPRIHIAYREPFVIQGSAVIGLKGDLDFRELSQVSECVNDYLRLGVKHFILSLTFVDHVNYLGVGILAALQKQAQNQEGMIKLAGVSPYVRDIFLFTGLAERFEFYASVEDALEGFHEDWDQVEKSAVIQ